MEQITPSSYASTSIINSVIHCLKKEGGSPRTTSYFLCIVLPLLVLFTSASASAEILKYHLKFQKDSPIKNISLKKTEVLIQFHRHGNSIGRLITKTDEKQDISFSNIYGKNLVVHVLSIKDAGKRVRCRGVSQKKTRVIEVRCH